MGNTEDKRRRDTQKQVFSREELLNAVEENTVTDSTSLTVDSLPNQPVEFYTDNGDLMEILLSHDDSRIKEVRVITDEGPICRMSPSEFSGGRLTAVAAEFDQSTLSSGADSEAWRGFTGIISNILRQVGVTTGGGIGGVSVVGVEGYR